MFLLARAGGDSGAKTAAGRQAPKFLHPRSRQLVFLARHLTATLSFHEFW